MLLDRDGTVIRERNYLSDPDGVELERGVAEALRLLSGAGFELVIVTNQSGIGRGYYTEDDYRAVHGRLVELLAAEDVTLAAEYHCPHHPTGGKGSYRRACDCRKPAPGMLRAAIRDLDLDPDRSFMVGDTLKDVAAGQAAGVRSVLVRTGYGAELAAGLGAESEVVPDFVATDLLEAVRKFVLAGEAAPGEASE